jgi:hypothetical protein
MRRFEKKSVPRGAKLGWWTVGNLGRCATLLYPKIAYGGRGWAETSESIVWSLRTSLEACEFWSRETWMLEDLGCWKIFSQALPQSISRQNDRVGDVASMMSGSTQRTTEEFFRDLARTLEGDSDKDACVGKENGSRDRRANKNCGRGNLGGVCLRIPISNPPSIEHSRRSYLHLVLA